MLRHNPRFSGQPRLSNYPWHTAGLTWSSCSESLSVRSQPSFTPNVTPSSNQLVRKPSICSSAFTCTSTALIVRLGPVRGILLVAPGLFLARSHTRCAKKSESRKDFRSKHFLEIAFLFDRGGAVDDDLEDGITLLDDQLGVTADTGKEGVVAEAADRSHGYGLLGGLIRRRVDNRLQHGLGSLVRFRGFEV